MADGWKFRLCQSSDMSLIGELIGSTSRRLEIDLNKSGQASGSIPTAKKIAAAIYPWSTCVVAQRDDEDLWSGPITTRSISLSAGRVDYSAVGWFERLMHLYLDDVLDFTATDPSDIISQLLTIARTKDARVPITMGQVNLSVARTITYQIDQNIGQAILDLSALESGVDWSIDPVTRELNVLSRIGRTRPNCKWMFVIKEDGTPDARNNLADVNELLDGTTVVNDITPRGQLGSGHAEDVVSKALLDGTFESRPSLSDVVDDDVLNAYAESEIVYLSTPRTTYTMTPKPSLTVPPPLGSPMPIRVPKFGEDFDIGDTTYLTAKRDFVEVTDQAERIFGVTLSIHDSGKSETLSNLQTTAS